MEPKKALIITPFFRPNIGGAETFAEDLARVVSNKYFTCICTIDWKKPMVWQGLSLFRGLVALVRLNSAYRKMPKNLKYEKVYALGIIASAVCVLNKVKFNAVILALYDFKKQHPIFTRIINAAERVFVEGDKGKQDMLKLGIPANKIIKFQHWCDQSRFQYVVRNHKRLEVLFIGRPIKIKGKHIIEECETMTEDIYYEYVENVPYKELPDYYKWADVVVVPSLYSEGFSRVVIEAASSGCILVTSNRGALPELVKGFGICIEPTAINYCNTLNKLKSNMLKVEGLQVKTAWYAKKHFSAKNAEVFL